MLWWLLLAALFVVVLIVAWRRSSRTKPVPRQPGKPQAGKPQAGKPQAGEIWWADVPYEDYSGHKVRPCVVLRGRGAYREVLKITSQDQSRRDDHVRIPTKSWDPGADHDSYLDLTGPVKVALAEFDDRAGVLDPAVWRKVQQLYGLKAAS
jgi:hypothetical protein